MARASTDIATRRLISAGVRQTTDREMDSTKQPRLKPRSTIRGQGFNNGSALKRHKNPLDRRTADRTAVAAMVVPVSAMKRTDRK